jgi:hypothetical protein
LLTVLPTLVFLTDCSTDDEDEIAVVIGVPDKTWFINSVTSVENNSTTTYSYDASNRIALKKVTHGTTVATTTYVCDKELLVSGELILR